MAKTTKTTPAKRPTIKKSATMADCASDAAKMVTKAVVKSRKLKADKPTDALDAAVAVQEG